MNCDMLLTIVLNMLITAITLPELKNNVVKSGHEYVLDDFSVDTMLLDGHTIVCLYIDSNEFQVNDKAFNALHANLGEEYHADHQEFNVDDRELFFDRREFRSNDQDPDIYTNRLVFPFNLNDQESSLDRQEYRFNGPDSAPPCSHFKGTGHYPISQATTPLGSPLFVAAVRLELLWHFTTVKDGASARGLQ